MKHSSRSLRSGMGLFLLTSAFAFWAIGDARGPDAPPELGWWGLGCTLAAVVFLGAAVSAPSER